MIVAVVPLVFTPFSQRPFADAKFLFLVLGVFLVWLSRPRIDRRLAWAAAAWVGVSAAAAVAGVDPLRSLSGTDTQLTGLIMIGACGYLLVVGASLTRPTVDDARRWLLGAGTAVAVVGIVNRTAPAAIGDLVPHLRFIGSTLGNTVFASTFLAVALAALIGSRLRASWTFVSALVLGSALGAFGERSSILLPLVALVVGLWGTRATWKRSALIAAPVVSMLVVWQLALPLLPEPLLSAGAQFESGAAEQQRVVAWGVLARGLADRPLLGWGPANTWSAFLSSATPEDVESVGRGFGDAHNLFIEVAVTTGVLGLVALLFLLVITGRRILRNRHGDRWLYAALAVLVVFQLVSPLNLVLTPLLFLLLGAAAAPDVVSITGSIRTGGLGASSARTVVGAALVISIVVAAMVAVASSFERWGRTYDDPSHWALRASVRIQPWRSSAAEGLALTLALDGRGSAPTSPAAGQEARRVIGDTVDAHPWDPGVRLVAAGVEQLLRNPDGTAQWLDQQVAMFPGDEGWLAAVGTEPSITIPDVPVPIDPA